HVEIAADRQAEARCACAAESRSASPRVHDEARLGAARNLRTDDQYTARRFHRDNNSARGTHQSSIPSRRSISDTPTYPRKIFAERFEGALARYPRRTMAAGSAGGCPRDAQF